MSTSPVRCSHFTLGNPKKVMFNIIDTYFWLFTLSEKETNRNSLGRLTTLTCEMQSFFVLLKVCCVPSNVGSSEKNTLCVGIGGSGKNRLWCVATGILGKQCHSKCSKWPPSAWIQSFSPLINGIVHHALLKFSPCRNKPLPQLVSIAD